MSEEPGARRFRSNVRSRERQLALLAENVRDYGIFLLDREGNIETWNAGAERIKGYTAEEIIGRHFSAFYTDADRARNHPAWELEEATREGSYQEEGWRVRKDGTHFWSSVTITAIHDEAGELTGFAKVTRDLTERKVSEEALRRSNEELDRFASVAAHDLSGPLRTIAGFADLLLREELTDTGREYAAHILAITERMQRLVSSLLAYARAGEESLDRETVDVAEAAHRIFADLRTAIRDSRAEMIVEAEGTQVEAVPEDVELVLRNLIGNALKFVPEEGGRVEVTARRQGEVCRVEVADNGIGIEPADQERIFSAFQRAHPPTDEPGSGLGLAICQRVVGRYEGRIGVESAPGQGSRFWFTLPAVTP